MRRSWTWLLAFLMLLVPPANGQSPPILHEKRHLPSDLEVGGGLAGLPAESTRYLSREELLAMRQVTFTVTGDANFTTPAKIRGVELAELDRRLGAPSASDMVVAISDDGYRGNYPHSYLVAHHPVLVLEVDGKPPAGWPKGAEDHTSNMGPFMISHPKFKSGHKILSEVEEAQIPWGVVRIEFRHEKIVFGAIVPRGPHAQDPGVRDGYRIAERNCFRCHNEGSEGGQKSGRSWESLSRLAVASPEDFAGYVRAPEAKNAQAQMPGNPGYDDRTLNALTAYFRTFSQFSKP
jgi:hypothetical protein